MSDEEQKISPTEQMDKMMENRHRVCACCGKEFFLPYHVDLTQYAYKMVNPMVKGKKCFKEFNSHLWFCSWKCLRAFEQRGTVSKRSINTVK